MTGFSRLFRLVPVLALMTALTACTVRPAGETGEVWDPYEASNRDTHELNKALDRGIVRPVSVVYAGATQGAPGRAISNFATNLGEPANMVNHGLQGDIQGLATSFARLAINTLFGFGGLVDVAGGTGLAEDATDFGETLHVWGAPEGAYIEMPVLGPSTERDAVGFFVDILIDPVGYVASARTSRIGTGIRIADKAGDRGRFADTVDSILYDSADSYAQSRLIYLQNRRYELGGGGADAYVDPYSDPYADPYAE